ncbi:MAG: hypothetical protein DRH26_02275 [Deltaproteobacteria bacterium]|nr:MAG: hypothetical protein DRH26_02275 [Deltaproteobacteria bacterium]
MKEEYTEEDFKEEFSQHNLDAGLFILKFCKGTSIPFSEFDQKQVAALTSAAGGYGLYQELDGKPFDSFFLKHQKAYVVVMFYVPGKQKMVYYIEVEDFLSMQEDNEREQFMTERLAEDYSYQRENYFETRRKKWTAQI